MRALECCNARTLKICNRSYGYQSKVESFILATTRSSQNKRFHFTLVKHTASKSCESRVLEWRERANNLLSMKAELAKRLTAWGPGARSRAPGGVSGVEPPAGVQGAVPLEALEF